MTVLYSGPAPCHVASTLGGEAAACVGQESGVGWGSPSRLARVPGPCFHSHHQGGAGK